MKTIRRVLAAALAVVMIVAMSAVSFAGSSISEKEAVKKALKSAKLSKSKVVRLQSEYDDGHYEVEFVKKSNGAKYEFEYSKSGKLRKKSIEYAYKHNSSKDKIGKTAARKKATKFTKVSLKAVKKGTCRYEYDDGEGKYELRFKKGSYKYEVDILAPTGKVIEFEKKLIKK